MNLCEIYEILENPKRLEKMRFFFSWRFVITGWRPKSQIPVSAFPPNNTFIKMPPPVARIRVFHDFYSFYKNYIDEIYKYL